MRSNLIEAEDDGTNDVYMVRFVRPESPLSLPFPLTNTMYMRITFNFSPAAKGVIPLSHAFAFLHFTFVGLDEVRP